MLKIKKKTPLNDHRTPHTHIIFFELPAKYRANTIFCGFYADSLASFQVKFLAHVFDVWIQCCDQHNVWFQIETSPKNTNLYKA